MAWVAPDGVQAAGHFLVRVLRLDPASVVRLRPSPDAVEWWSRLPFGVLASRRIPGVVSGDVTVRADALLAALEPVGPLPLGPLPLGRDTDWRWPLPPAAVKTVERLPVAEIVRVSEAAAKTIRTASVEGVGGRAVGSRALRDALLDHVPIVVRTDDGQRYDVPQRLVQAITRMGFLPVAASDQVVEVRVAGPWVGLAAPYGSAWYRPPLLLR